MTHLYQNRKTPELYCLHECFSSATFLDLISDVSFLLRSFQSISTFFVIIYSLPRLVHILKLFWS